MTASHIAGPSITFGSGPSGTGAIGSSGSQGSNPEAGPNVDYQGSSILDTRWPYSPGKTGLGQVIATLNYAYACLCDCVPSIKNASIVAAAQAPVVPVGGSVAMTLASTNQISPTTNGNRSVNVPLVPFGSGLNPANAVKVMCLDAGHTTGTTNTSNKSVASVGDTRLIRLGQYVCIPGAAGTGVALITRVTAKTATTITLADQPTAVVTAGPIMLMEYRAPSDNLGGASVVPWYYAGAAAMIDPHVVPGRVLTYTSNNAGDTGYSVTVTGYDFFGVPMTETKAITANTTVTGSKAFKYIASATLSKSGGGTPTGTISIGTSDTFGFGVKSELWEYMNLFFAGAFISSNTGWTAADTTTPSATTGDVRGTYALQSPSTGAANTGRFAAFMSLPARQLIGANYDDSTSMYGLTQF